MQDFIYSSKLSSNLKPNIILASIPMRHNNKPELGIKITSVNSQLEQLCNEVIGGKLLPLHILPRHYYTVHGMHFNRKGTNKISQMACKLLLGQEVYALKKTSSFSQQWICLTIHKKNLLMKSSENLFIKMNPASPPLATNCVNKSPLLLAAISSSISAQPPAIIGGYKFPQTPVNTITFYSASKCTVWWL